jgi:hypothetical protein
VRFATLLLVLWALLGTRAATGADYLRDATGTAGLDLGHAVALVGDQDGDGAAELLAGAPGFQAQGQDAGRAYLWFGRPDLRLDADHVWTGRAGEHFGHAVAAIGDVNADGVADFAVGAPYADDAGFEAGRVYVFYGGTPLPASADLVLEGPAANARFGWAVAAAGDLDGDGIDDLAVGAPYHDAGGSDAGSVHIYHGGSGGLATAADVVLPGRRPLEHFGWSLAGIGEFLGPGADCLAVGAPSHATSSTTIAGRAYVFAGPDPGPEPELTLASSATAAADNEFGYSLAAVGSVDGDGTGDLAVGVPFYDGGGLERGRVEIFLGGADADDQTDVAIDGPAAGSRLGWSVAAAGDVTGSGLPDVLMGAPFDDALGTEAGRAFLWPGGSGDVSDASSLPQAERGAGLAGGTAPQDHFGFWCAGGADLDGDGRNDHAIGAPAGNLVNLATAGWVRLNDTSGTLVPVVLGAWSCRWTASGAVSGSVPLAGAAGMIARAELLRHDLVAGRSERIFAGTPGPAAATGRGAAGSAPAGRTARVLISGADLVVHDPDAAYRTAGQVRYTLRLEAADGTELTTAELAGPAGPAPRPRAELAPAAPNPANPRTVVGFRAAAGAAVRLEVVDLRGRRLRTLHAGPATGRWQEAAWDGRDAAGRPAPSGTYLVRLSGAGEIARGSLSLIR